MYEWKAGEVFVGKIVKQMRQGQEKKGESDPLRAT